MNSYVSLAFFCREASKLSHIKKFAKGGCDNEFTRQICLDIGKFKKKKKFALNVQKINFINFINL